MDKEDLKTKNITQLLIIIVYVNMNYVLSLAADIPNSLFKLKSYR